MAKKEETVIFEIDGQRFVIRKKLWDAIEGRCQLDDEFRKTFTKDEKEVILRVLIVH